MGMRYEVKTNDEAEALEGLNPWQHRKCDDRRENGCQGVADHETLGGRVGLVGARRKQENRDHGEGDGQGPVRPFGHDPEKLNDADHDERAPRIDERWQPIGHADLEATAARNRPSRSTNKQREPVERIRNAVEHPSRVVGE